MNVLPKERQIQILNALVEGNSIRSTARMVGVEHKTVMRVLLRTGERCHRILDENMRCLPCRIVQVDEIWTFVAKKEKRTGQTDNRALVGDQYIALSHSIPSPRSFPTFRIGKRDAANAWHFVQDLQGRLSNRVQLTTDGFRPYLTAVEDAFGGNVDYAMLIKTYQETKNAEKRYSPGEIVTMHCLYQSQETPKPRLYLPRTLNGRI